ECQRPGFPGGDQHVDFNALRATLVAEKPGVEQAQAALLAARYDLSDRPSPTVTMSRSKPVQVGVRVKLPAAVTWALLAGLSPDQIRQQGRFPPGFMV